MTPRVVELLNIWYWLFKTSYKVVATSYKGFLMSIYVLLVLRRYIMSTNNTSNSNYNNPYFYFFYIDIAATYYIVVILKVLAEVFAYNYIILFHMI